MTILSPLLASKPNKLTFYCTNSYDYKDPNIACSNRAQPRGQRHLATSGQDDYLQGEKLVQRLKIPISYYWRNQSFRHAAMTSSKEWQVYFFIDRRLNPRATINLEYSGGSLEEGISALAHTISGESAPLHGLVYIGPKEMAHKISTLIFLRKQEISKEPLTSLSIQQKNSLRRREKESWPILSTPQAILERIAKKQGFTVTNLDLVPHDLYPETDLPPLDFTEKFSLLLAGFDLTYQLNPAQKSITLKPIPSPLTLTKTFSLRQKNSPQEIASFLKETYPLATIELNGKKIRVTSTLYTLDKVGAHLSDLAKQENGKITQQNSSSNETARKTYTITVKNQPALAVLGAITSQTDYTYTIAPKLQPLLQTHISFSAEKANLDRLLRETLSPVGLRFHLDGKKIVITR
ncbi:MAG: hypothetical protein MPJ24_08875 [Pirellulaceae bacterium]|nr:hypothetical protein [Pirellulaceae bacterium]